jgi:hypothetical protein
MARGSAGGQGRKEARAESRKKENEDSEFEFPMPTTSVDNEGDEPATTGNETETDDHVPIVKKKKKKKKKSSSAAAAPTDQEMPPPKQGIKSGPLILLVMLTGTTLLPALLYAGDYFTAFLSKSNVMGTLGHKLNIGSSPRKRVLSFYEKHDPVKVDDVESILSKYYGDYPTLIKRLERKYQDYGYFLNWEQDEAPMTLAFEKLYDTRDFAFKQYDLHAPPVVKKYGRNVAYNLNTLRRKGRVIWKKTLWPILEPFFGVPDGGAAQKRQDRADAKDRGGRRKKNTEYRED